MTSTKVNKLNQKSSTMSLKYVQYKLNRDKLLDCFNIQIVLFKVTNMGYLLKVFCSI